MGKVPLGRELLARRGDPWRGAIRCQSHECAYRGQHLQWKLPDPILPNLSPEFCLSLWQDLSKIGGIRLALTTFCDNQSEIIQNFRNYAATSVYLQMPFPRLGLVWHWPVRIGFLVDPVSTSLQDIFLKEREKHETVRTLTEISSVEQANSFEFLILPAPIGLALQLLNNSPVTVQAHCLILLSTLPESFSQLAALVRRTHSAGALFHPIPRPSLNCTPISFGTSRTTSR
jgi:hypothetical protein